MEETRQFSAAGERGEVCEPVCEAIVESIAHGVIVTDGRQDVLFANASACELLGYPREELAAENLLHLVPAEDHAKILSGVQQPYASHGQRHETTVCTKDGRLRTVALRVRLLPGGATAKPGAALAKPGGHNGDERCIWTFQDITDFQQAHRTLKAQGEFCECLTESIRAAVLVLDSRARILRANRFARELTGYTAQELTDANCLDLLLPPSRRRQMREVLRRVLARRPIDPAQDEIPVLAANADDRDAFGDPNHPHRDVADALQPDGPAVGGNVE